MGTAGFRATTVKFGRYGGLPLAAAVGGDFLAVMGTEWAVLVCGQS